MLPSLPVAERKGSRRRNIGLLLLVSAASGIAASIGACLQEIPALREGDASRSGDADGSTPPDAAGDAPVGPEDASDAAAPSYVEAVLGDHPLAYWRFDEPAASRVANDSSDSGINHPLSYVGDTVTFGTPGALLTDPGNTAVTLSPTGTGSFFDGGDILSFAGNKAFTLEVWFEPGPAPVPYNQGYREILGRSTGMPPQYGYIMSVAPAMNAGDTRALIGQRTFDGGGGDTAVGPSLSDAGGSWMYLVLTYDGVHELLLYANGRRSGDNGESTLPIGQAAGEAFLVGGGNGALSGGLDEIAVYDHPLDGGTITAHWRAAGYP